MSETQKIALITGAARRIGAEIAKELHAAGYGVVVHYRYSSDEAAKLVAALNILRSNSTWMVQGDIQLIDDIKRMVDEAVSINGRLDAVINNASSFYPTPVGGVDDIQWNDLMGINLKAPFFVSQEAFPALKQSQGCIVNIVDIYAKRALSGHPIYSVSKSGLYMLTKSLAKEFAPKVRVNGVSPGTIMWPEHRSVKDSKSIIKNIPLQRQGSPKDVAETVHFLVTRAAYITGQVIEVDGGKSLV